MRDAGGAVSPISLRGRGRRWSCGAAEQTGLKTVALSGGVFCNEIVSTELTGRAASRGRGLRVLRHRMVPPNDGGLSLGQAAIAAATS